MGIEMEQRWTVDRYDVPSGDLEFWALRLGKIPAAANQNDCRYVPGCRRRQIMMRVSLAVAVAAAVVFALT
ncbi:hypothetical protein [Mesorhizobium marinum]|uniref:Uncharacterized protein n=1 Tax=Mesorhizobium marinum TaxID=3228790 RepID=A0ABV3QVT9_9HYPH